jgi:hypothetical protein
MIWRREDGERRGLIEAVTTAHRARDVEGHVVFSPAWRDLAPADRDEAFEAQNETRLIERALDPEGLSATVRSVLDRLS